MAQADKANQYINDKEPWVLAKTDKQSVELQAICSTGINASATSLLPETGPARSYGKS